MTEMKPIKLGDKVEPLKMTLLKFPEAKPGKVTKIQNTYGSGHWWIKVSGNRGEWDVKYWRKIQDTYEKVQP